MQKNTGKYYLPPRTVFYRSVAEPLLQETSWSPDGGGTNIDIVEGDPEDDPENPGGGTKGAPRRNFWN